jgi:hypothetical protein
MNERSNGSHSPFRPTRLSPPGYRPYAEQERKIEWLTPLEAFEAFGPAPEERRNED